MQDPEEEPTLKKLKMGQGCFIDKKQTNHSICYNSINPSKY